MNKDIKINTERETIEAWLFSQPRDRIIDIGDPCGCIFHHFLKETQNIKADVFHSFFNFNVPFRGSIDLPEWFVKMIGCPQKETYRTIGEIQDKYLETFPETFIKGDEKESKIEKDSQKLELIEK